MRGTRIILYLSVLLMLPVLVFAGGEKEKSTGPLEVKIVVWAKGRVTGPGHWRADVAPVAAQALNKELAAEGSNITVVTEHMNDEGSWGDYKKKFAMAAEDGQAPDIICSGHEDIATWAQAGYLIPIADSAAKIKAMAPELDDVIDSLWDCVTWNGKIWGVPQDTEARPMFFSKTKLKQMGWSDAEVAALPDKIAKGQFTLEDLIATAQKALQMKVVEPGYGYWPRPQKGGDFIQYYCSHGGILFDEKEGKMVVVQDALERWYSFQRKIVETGITPDKFIGMEWKIWHDNVANDKALFWNGGIWQWDDWASNYAPGGEATLFKNVGYALQPASKAGGQVGTLSHPLVYLVTSEKVSKNKHKDIVIRLLSKMIPIDVNTEHAVTTAHIGVLKSQLDYAPYKASKFLADVSYMMNKNYYQPNHPMYGIYFDIVWNGMLATMQGQKKASDAAKEAVDFLKRELGDEIIVK